MWSSLRIDVTLLKGDSDFRRVFVAGSISMLGSFTTYVALPLQMAQLTGSYLAVGFMGVVELVPLVVFGLWGGVLADRVDRRRMVLWCELSFIVVLGALVANAWSSQPQAFVLYAAGACFAVIDGLQRPSLGAMLPRLVAPNRLAEAGALMSLRSNAAFVGGPALGGVIVASSGAAGAYLFDILTFAISAFIILRIAPVPPTVLERSHVLLELRDGVRYAFSRKDIVGTYVVDTIAMVFAYSNALLPFVALQYNASWALGALYAAPAVGSLIASATSGWITRVHRHGRAVAFAAMAWGLAMAAIGIAPNVYFTLAFLAIAGAADMVSGLFRGLIWNLTIPDSVRGRMAGIEMLSYSIGPQLAGIRASFVAKVTSLQLSFITGGLAATVLISLAPQALSALWQFDDRTNEHALREREVRASAHENTTHE